MKFLITGGAGFIGSTVIRNLINNTDHYVINFDNLTYAGDLSSLESVSDSERYYFQKGDICNMELVKEVLEQHQPDILMHLAAESHVDRSIDSPLEFINTNIIGTYVLLEEVRKFLSSGRHILFHHVSTDEVFGDLEKRAEAFNENSPYEPSSPYSASKASSDHLVRSWGRTFGLPFVITNCSNNFGPFQFPEKLIPNTILKAMKSQQIPVYGDGEQIRDWLYVEDHADALIKVATKGKNGDTYNIGSRNAIANLTLVKMICSILDDLVPKGNSFSHSDLIVFVKDRPGHDRHYSIDPSKIKKEIGWESKISFKESLRDTVKWYLENTAWVEHILEGKLSVDRIGLNLGENN